MTSLELTKHHALGNDFLVTFHPPVPEDHLPELARRLCARTRGIGADGLLIAASAPGHSARMALFNADGTRAEMSGNGIRCFAQALADRRGDHHTQRILTDAGERIVEFVAVEGDTIHAAVSMGAVGRIDAPPNWAEIAADPLRPVAHLDVGNPHSVVAVDDVRAVDLAALGVVVPSVNLEVVEHGPEDLGITMRVHERGAGITEACGTGACASAYAARLWGMVDPDAPEIIVHMDGGDARVRFGAGDEVVLIGPATKIASITVEV